MALSIRAAAPAHRATAMGVYQALYAIGMLTGPVLGGFAADGLGLGSVFYMSGALALAAGGLVLLPVSARR
jgi:predicted MFS family arabinose efflux permease